MIQFKPSMMLSSFEGTKKLGMPAALTAVLLASSCQKSPQINTGNPQTDLYQPQMQPTAVQPNPTTQVPPPTAPQPTTPQPVQPTAPQPVAPQPTLAQPVTDFAQLGVPHESMSQAQKSTLVQVLNTGYAQPILSSQELSQMANSGDYDKFMMGQNSNAALKVFMFSSPSCGACKELMKEWAQEGLPEKSNVQAFIINVDHPQNAALKEYFLTTPTPGFLVASNGNGYILDTQNRSTYSQNVGGLMQYLYQTP